MSILLTNNQDITPRSHLSTSCNWSIFQDDHIDSYLDEYDGHDETYEALERLFHNKKTMYPSSTISNTTLSRDELLQLRRYEREQLRRIKTEKPFHKKRTQQSYCKTTKDRLEREYENEMEHEDDGEEDDCLSAEQAISNRVRWGTFQNPRFEDLTRNQMNSDLSRHNQAHVILPQQQLIHGNKHNTHYKTPHWLQVQFTKEAERYKENYNKDFHSNNTIDPMLKASQRLTPPSETWYLYTHRINRQDGK